ncbi:unnamed protein product [Schistosoma rodhaini]|nr:unnamed protein product [Schistosoma rodhaini]
MNMFIIIIIQLFNRIYQRKTMKFIIPYYFIKQIFQICIIILLLNVIFCLIIFIHNIIDLSIEYEEPENILEFSSHTTYNDNKKKLNKLKYMKENHHKNSEKYYEYYKTTNTNYIEPILLPSSHCDHIMNNNTTHNTTDNNNNNITNIIIFIKSTYNKFKLRQTLRNTWANSKCYLKYGIQPYIYFTLGRENSSQWFNSTIQIKLFQEHQQYNDLIQFNFIENYYNLTRKLIGTIEYAKFHCIHTKFIIIIDQDFIINPLNLIKLLLNITKLQYNTYISGYVIKKGIPFRIKTNKWFISKYKYPFKYYPNYPLGGTIIMSRPVMYHLYELLRHIKLFPFDDVLIGIVLDKLNITIHHIDNILLTNYIMNYRKQFITAHYKDISYLLMNLWKSLRFDKLCYN